MYVRPALEGFQPTTFGVSGKLWRGALVMYDRQTLSLWSQIDGRAVAGPSDGERLREIPSQVTTWKDWYRRHPQTLVLVKPPLTESPYRTYHERGFAGLPWSAKGDQRLSEKALVLGVRQGGDAVAITADVLGRVGVLPFRLGAHSLLAVAPPGTTARLVYRQPTDAEREGLRIELQETPGGLLLEESVSGRQWNWETGEAVDLLPHSADLEPIPAHSIYWGIWSAYFPDTPLIDSVPEAIHE
ncbi:MAG: DUF3179 domain-containing protein [Deltaproteobacteria bacterium]|nr:DUF3179 domain-containing protein [Deltaproteobacteria bacterium]